MYEADLGRTVWYCHAVCGPSCARGRKVVSMAVLGTKGCDHRPQGVMHRDVPGELKGQVSFLSSEIPNFFSTKD